MINIIYYLSLHVLYTYIHGCDVNYMSNTYHKVTPWTMYSGGIMGTLFIIYVSKTIKDIPIISYCGRYSIMILVTHYPLIKLIKPIIERWNIPTWRTIFIIWLVLLFISLLIIPLFKKYIPQFTAQKDIIKIDQTCI